MPKPSDEKLDQYPALKGIPDDEWDDIFDHDGEDWTTKEVEYLLDWIEKDNVYSLAYALGRTPGSIQKYLSRLRSEGRKVPYLRKGHEDVGVITVNDELVCRVVLPRTMTASAVAVTLKNVLQELEKYEGQSKVTQFSIENEGSSKRPSYAVVIGVNGGEVNHAAKHA